MPFVPPLLDDRTWKDIRDEALARVPIYTPEWTDLRPGDPGVALVEVFAFMTEALIYRLNRVPDNSYLAFLNLLDRPLLPAQPARGLVQLAVGSNLTKVDVMKGTGLRAGSVRFSINDSLSVLPLELAAFVKVQSRDEGWKKDPDREAYVAKSQEIIEKKLSAVLRDRYPGSARAKAKLAVAPVHVETQVYPPTDGTALPIGDTADRTLWVAVLARKDDFNNDPARLEKVRKLLGEQILSIGVAPVDVSNTVCTECDPPLDENGNLAQPIVRPPALRWEISSPRTSTKDGPMLEWTALPIYEHLQLLSDTTEGLRRPGVIKLQLPPAEKLSTWKRLQIDLNEDPKGKFDPISVPLSQLPMSGDMPPTLSDGDIEARVLFWLRAVSAKTTGDEAPSGRPVVASAFTFIGPNSVDVTQAVPQDREYLGKGTGQPGQLFALQFRPVLRGVKLTVTEEGAPIEWREVESLDGASERDSVFVVDRALGTISVGDGLSGRVIPPGALLHASYKYGGGLAGNLPPGALRILEGPSEGLDTGKTLNPLPTYGGSETETVEQARRRIPMQLRHQSRAVTAEDFRELALLTPGASLGRVEILPLLHPTHFLNIDEEDKKALRPYHETPGVVSVLMIPAEDPQHPRAPRPDRNLRDLVCAHLDRHRLITTQVFVIGPQYRRVAVYLNIHGKQGYGYEDLRKWSCLALYQYLAPLSPFGPDGAGWPLGRKLVAADLIAAVLQVEGVAWVNELYLYEIKVSDEGVVEYKPLGEKLSQVKDGKEVSCHTAGELTLGVIELPELVEVQVGFGEMPPLPEKSASGQTSGQTIVATIPVPVFRSKC